MTEVLKMLKVDKYKVEISALFKSHKFLLIGFLTVGAVVFLSTLSEPKHDETTELKQEIGSADTYIPEGYTLVPIELENADALDALMGAYGVVDLFAASGSAEKASTIIARQVKIIRGSGDSRKFAVLIPEETAAQVVGYNGPLMASLQNPKRNQTRFYKKTKKSSRISVGEVQGDRL